VCRGREGGANDYVSSLCILKKTVPSARASRTSCQDEQNPKGEVEPCQGGRACIFHAEKKRGRMLDQIPRETRVLGDWDTSQRKERSARERRHKAGAAKRRGNSPEKGQEFMMPCQKSRSKFNRRNEKWEDAGRRQGNPDVKEGEGISTLRGNEGQLRTRGGIRRWRLKRRSSGGEKKGKKDSEKGSLGFVITFSKTESRRPGERTNCDVEWIKKQKGKLGRGSKREKRQTMV